MEIIDILFTASFWAAAIRIASPLIFATLGELICERAGVLNLGIEGIMVAGAFAGWMAVFSGTGLWMGVCVAMLVGMLFGLLHSTLTVPFGLSQHVVGLGVTLLATSSTYYAYRLALPEVTARQKLNHSSHMKSQFYQTFRCLVRRCFRKHRLLISPSFLSRSLA